MTTQNQRGFSLIEILVAISVMSIMIFTMMTFQDNQNKEIKGLYEKLAIADAQKVLSLSLSNNDVCLYTLNQPSPLTFDATVDVATVPANLNIINPIYSSVRPNGAGGFDLGPVVGRIGEAPSATAPNLIISAIKLVINKGPTPMPPPGTNIPFSGHWVIEFQSNRLTKPAKPIMVPTILIANTTNASNATIMSCMSSLSVGLGLNQTWQDVTATKTVNVDYVNDTVSPIMVSVSLQGHDGWRAYLVVDGVRTAYSYNDRYSGSRSMSTVVPPGAIYRVESTTPIQQWTELR